jgi:hypothetical protein
MTDRSHLDIPVQRSTLSACEGFNPEPSASAGLRTPFLPRFNTHVSIVVVLAEKLKHSTFFSWE